ncbi:MAG: lysophospholipid acyltransferase family protein [Chitinophagales bacterium]|jgi:KDO2-lipid IV(A) lauroyltransferase|nr:lysophospholipid acyltransferase family protein [Chitinophagales bacterium]
MIKVLAFLLQYVFGYRRAIVRQNTKIVTKFSLSELELNSIIQKHYRYFARLIIESISLPFMSKKQIYPKVTFTNFEVFEAIYQKRAHVTIILSHIGNWELFCIWAGYFIPNLKTVVLYTRLKSNFFNKLFLKIRTKSGTTLIDTQDTFGLFRLQRSSEPMINLFALDQNPGDPYNKPWIPFFNKLVPVNIGAEKFAVRMKQDVYFLHVACHLNHYTLTLKPIIYDPNLPLDLTEKSYALLEENIGAAPEFWLLSHNRFKHEKINTYDLE